MLENPPHLTFKEISDMWARENAHHPAGRSRDEILERFVKGLRNDEFDHAELTIKQANKYKVDSKGNYHVHRPAGWQPVTRDMLNYLLFRDLRDACNKQILEELRISKRGFRKWCKSQGYLPPIFWFDTTNSDAPPEADDRLRGSARYEDWANRQTSQIEDGKAENYREAAKQIANSEGVDIGFVERECRRVGLRSLPC